MDITTIVGIAIAVVIMAFGLKLIFKKPSDNTPSLDSELHINEDSQKPVIPRHVRDQLQVEEETPRIEPTLDASKIDETKQQELELEQAEPSLKVTENVALTDIKVEKKSEMTEEIGERVQAEVSITEVKDGKDEALNLIAQIQKAEILEFSEESSILDAHLYEQKIADDECELSNAELTIALNIYPQGRVLSGEKTLKVLLKYGLRFGELGCFHRYSEDGSQLLFSVLQISDTEIAGFDLETLSTEEVKGLAFFLALPHADVRNAFDTMDSTARLVAREIAGLVYDQNNQELTQQLRDHWRHQAIDYRVGKAMEI